MPRRLTPWITCGLALAASPALAQQQVRTAYEGAGADRRIPVSRPETTSRASGRYVRSVEPSLDPFGDPLKPGRRCRRRDSRTA